ncbi:MAG: DUF4214 domain-containing protein, partial [Pseudomonadota bacterium]
TEEQADIALLYEVVLDRSADIEGLQFWLSTFDTDNFTFFQLARAFVVAGEFLGEVDPEGTATTTEFVEALYQRALGRDADEEGLAFWTGSIDDGTLALEDLALAFALSDEIEDVAGNVQIIADFDLG